MQMMSSMMITIMMMTSIMLPVSKNLISLGTALITTTILATATTALLINSWFAFIMFLVLITGLLVLFSYMMAMSPNTSFNQKKSTLKTIGMLIIMMYPIFSTPTKPMKSEKSFEQDIQQLFNQSNMPMYWTMGIILLLALLMAVTICYKTAKPLRNYL